MKKRIWLIMIMTAILSLFCSGCSLIEQKEKLPEDTLEQFEEAVNNADVEGMIECMDDTSVKALKAGLNATLGVMKAVTGIDLGLSGSDLLDMMPLLQGMAFASGEDMSSMQVDFEVLETRIKNDKATIFFRDTISGESTFLNMKKSDGAWYITMDTKPIDTDQAEHILYPGQEENADQQDEKDPLSKISVRDLLEQLMEGNLLKQIIREIIN